MADWEEHHRSSAVEPYFCECANPECGEHVDLREADYERVRSDLAPLPTLAPYAVLNGGSLRRALRSGLTPRRSPCRTPRG
jgi:hypothetical protein